MFILVGCSTITNTDNANIEGYWATTNKNAACYIYKTENVSYIEITIVDDKLCQIMPCEILDSNINCTYFRYPEFENIKYTMTKNTLVFELTNGETYEFILSDKNNVDDVKNKIREMDKNSFINK